MCRWNVNLEYGSIAWRPAVGWNQTKLQQVQKLEGLEIKFFFFIVSSCTCYQHTINFYLIYTCGAIRLQAISTWYDENGISSKFQCRMNKFFWKVIFSIVCLWVGWKFENYFILFKQGSFKECETVFWFSIECWPIDGVSIHQYRPGSTFLVPPARILYGAPFFIYNSHWKLLKT